MRKKNEKICVCFLSHKTASNNNEHNDIIPPMEINTFEEMEEEPQIQPTYDTERATMNSNNNNNTQKTREQKKTFWEKYS